MDVLDYLHNHKPPPIVFRDLKPSNVMLAENDRIVLIDFGIAKAFQSARKGTMIGTEGYCPPEQYRGMSEPRGDLYSLGGDDAPHAHAQRSAAGSAVHLP